MTVTNQATGGKKSRRRRVAAVLLVLAGVGVGVSVTTNAILEDQEVVNNNTFGTGTIDLVVGPTTAAFTAPNMMPGDSVYAALTVGNSGNQALRYAMSKSDTSPSGLDGLLTLAVSKGNTSCNAAGWASGSVVSAERTFWDSDLVFGDAAHGAQAGDRTLAGGASEVLCVKVTLPVSANPAPGDTMTSLFRFDAEQTINNP